MYVAVFIAAYFFTPSVSYEILGNEQNKWLVITGLLLRPSQGTLNAIFFVYHKIYDLRKCNDDLRICEALYISIVEPFKVPEIIIDFGGLETGEVRIIQRPRWFYELQEEGESPEVTNTRDRNDNDPSSDSMVSSGRANFSEDCSRFSCLAHSSSIPGITNVDSQGKEPIPVSLEDGISPR